MSWNSYIDNMIAQCKDAGGASHCDQGSIIGMEGGAAWTTCDHESALKLKPEEAQKIATCFKNKDFGAFATTGIYLNEVKYQFIREADGTVYGKKKGSGAITLQASKTAIVIGHCPEGCQQGNTNKGVAVIANYLESLGM